MRPIVLLFKSLIPAHTRRLKTGKVVNVRQYTDKRTKRLEDDKTLDMFADDDTITTPRQEMIDEHKRLVDVLESPSRKDDKAEAKKQKEELEEYEEKADPRANQHADVGEALASKGWKKQGDRWKKTYQDVRALGAANVTTGEWSVRFDRSFAVIERGWDKQTVMLADNFSPEKNADRIIEKVEEQVEAERKRYGGKPAKPTDDTPQIDAMIARAKALGFDGIGIKASLELYRNGRNPGQGVTSREEGIANLERMLAAAEAKAKPAPKAKVGDLASTSRGIIGKIARVHENGEVDIDAGDATYYNQTEFSSAHEADYHGNLRTRIAEKRKAATQLRKEAAAYNRETGGEAVRDKNKVITVPARMGGKGVDIIPFTRNRAGQHHQELLDSAAKLNREADHLESLLPQKPARDKPVSLSIKTIKTQAFPGGSHNGMHVTNIPQNVLDALGYKGVWFKPGMPQTVYGQKDSAPDARTDDKLFEGDVTSELIPHLKERLSAGKGKTPRVTAVTRGDVPAADDDHPAPKMRASTSSLSEADRARWLSLHQQQHEIHYHDRQKLGDQMDRVRSKRNKAETAMREAEAGLKGIRSAPVPDPGREREFSEAVDKARAEFDQYAKQLDTMASQHEILVEREEALGKQKNAILPGSGDLRMDLMSGSRISLVDEANRVKDYKLRYRDYFKNKPAKTPKVVSVKASKPKADAMAGVDKMLDRWEAETKAGKDNPGAISDPNPGWDHRKYLDYLADRRRQGI